MEEELIARIRQGDLQALDSIYESYKGPAMRTAYLIAGNKVDCEDIVQESFIKCYQSIGTLKDNEHFKGWFFKILIRTAWSYCKKRKREVPQEETLEKEDKLYDERKTPLSPMEEVIHKEYAKHIMDLIKTLPDKQRLVIILYYYNEFSTKEIAKIVGCFEGTVKSRLFTARNKLKKDILKHQEEGITDEVRLGRSNFQST